MPMEATKTTSFIAGALIVLSQVFIELYSFPAGVFAFIFFFLIFFLVIGKQIFREYERQLRNSNEFDRSCWNDPEGKRFAVRLITRMLFLIFGWLSVATVIDLVNVI